MDALLIGTVLVTSTLSGVFGMAGGMLLLAVLLAGLPIADAMVLHGAAQAFANGARALISYRHIRLSIVVSFTAGAALVLFVLSPTGFVVRVEPALILLGAVPLTEPLWRRLSPPSIERFAGGFGCGALATGFHLAAGTGGPLLDLFFVRSALQRHAIVATKAAAQTVGHIAKIAYFGWVLGPEGAAHLSLAVWLGLAASSIVGTYLGRLILDRLSEQSFRRGARMLITTIAVACVLRGSWLLCR